MPKKERRNFRNAPMERGGRFVWGPGDLEVTYSPSGKYPPGNPGNQDRGETEHKAAKVRWDKKRRGGKGLSPVEGGPTPSPSYSRRLWPHLTT